MGRVVNGEGIKHDPERLKALRELPAPITAGDLQQFLCGVNWMRSSLPNYNVTVAPLQELLEQALRAAGKRTKSAAKKQKLADHGWSTSHEEAWSKAKLMLNEAIVLAHPDPDKEFCLYTDASISHWGGVLTQIPAEDLPLPREEQRHEPLAFLSGSFKGASYNWNIVEKEGYAVIAATDKLAYLLHRQRGFHLYVDHKNILYIMNPNGGATTMVPKHVEDRLQRWAIRLMGFKYVIHHVPGEENYLADILSRWPNSGVHLRVARGVPAQSSRRKLLQQRRAQVWLRVRKKHRRTKVVTRKKNLRADDFGPAKVLHLVPTGTTYPSAQAISEAQRSAVSSGAAFECETREVEVPLDGAESTCIMIVNNETGAWWIPPEVDHLRLRLCVIAHGGASGHRGMKSTYEALSAKFFWKGMREDVNEFLRQCLHCLTTKGGKRVPRPYGSQIHADKPSQVLHMDYLFIMKPTADCRHEFSYCLVIKDDFSGFLSLTPAVGPTAWAAAQALLE